jgi:hypothetical protein
VNHFLLAVEQVFWGLKEKALLEENRTTAGRKVNFSCEPDISVATRCGLRMCLCSVDVRGR